MTRLSKHSAIPTPSRPMASAHPSSGDPLERHRLIQEAAYSLYERGGFVHGHDLDDWLAAEAYIDAMISEQGHSASAAPDFKQGSAQADTVRKPRAPRKRR